MKKLLLFPVLFACAAAAHAGQDMPTLDAARQAKIDADNALTSGSVIQQKQLVASAFDGVARENGTMVTAHGLELGARKDYTAQVTPVAPQRDGPPPPATKNKGLLDGGIAALLPIGVGAALGGTAGYFAATALGLSTFASVALGAGIGIAGMYLMSNGNTLAGMGLMAGFVIGALAFPANPILGGLAIGGILAGAGYLINSFLGG